MKRTPLRRTVRLKRTNKERRQRLWVRQYHSLEYLAWVKLHGCFTCGAPATDAHHVHSKGAWGDWRSIVGLCSFCHREFHVVGRSTFCLRRGTTVKKLEYRAEELAARFERGGK